MLGEQTHKPVSELGLEPDVSEIKIGFVPEGSRRAGQVERKAVTDGKLHTEIGRSRHPVGQIRFQGNALCLRVVGKE